MFRRDGADIHSDLFISIAQAILGGTARAQGLYETINVVVRGPEWCFCPTPTSLLFSFFLFLKWKIADKWLEPLNNQHVWDSGKMRCRRGRTNAWPFLGCESQTVGLECHHQGQQFLAHIPSCTGPGSSLSNILLCWLYFFPGLAFCVPSLGSPPQTTCPHNLHHRVFSGRTQLISQFACGGWRALSRSPNASSFQGVRLSICSEMFSFEQLETKENHRCPFLIDPPWGPDRPEDSNEWERHPSD